MCALLAALVLVVALYYLYIKDELQKEQPRELVIIKNS